jgi:hypothetical protein
MSSPSNTQDLTKPYDKPVAAPPARVRKYSEYNSDNDSSSTTTSTDRACSKKQKTDTSPYGLDGSADLSPQDLTQLLKQEEEEFGYKADVYESPGWADECDYSALPSRTDGWPRSPSTDSWDSDRSEDWPVDMEVDDGDSIRSETTDTTDDSDSTDDSDDSDCSTDCDCSVCDAGSTSSNCSTDCDCSTCGDVSTSSDDSTGSDDSDTTNDSDDSQDDNDIQNDNEDDNDGLDDDSDEEVDLFTEAYRNAIDQNRKHEG